MQLPKFLEISQSILQENALSVQFSGGTTFSFPVLVRRQDKLMDAMFLYPAPGSNERVAQRPHAWMMLSSVNGQVALLSDCAVQDFVDSELFPLDGFVSMELPRLFSAKAYTKAYQAIYEVYESLRLFAFASDPDDRQFKAMAQYRALFLQLVPTGHYPFYAALAPEFFRWIGLKLVEEPENLQEPVEIVTPAIAPESEPVPESAPPLQDAAPALAGPTVNLEPVLGELVRLRAELTAKNEADLHRELLLDNMHAQLTEYKNGLLDALTASLENDIIKLIDDVAKSVGAYKKKTATKDNYKKLLSLLDGLETDLCDLLYRHGLEPFNVDGDVVDIYRQKILAVKPTTKPSLDKKTALRHARGWEKNGKVIRPERITVYIYTPPEAENPEEKD